MKVGKGAFPPGTHPRLLERGSAMSPGEGFGAKWTSFPAPSSLRG